MSTFSSYHQRFRRNTHQDTRHYGANETLPNIYCICKQVTSLTCWLGPGEDELCGAAALDLSVAGVNVYAVDCERLQASDLQLTLRHRLLRKLKLSVYWLHFSDAAVTSGLERRDSAAVGVQSVAARVSGVGYSKEIPAATIWWPGEEEKVGSFSEYGNITI